MNNLRILITIMAMFFISACQSQNAGNKSITLPPDNGKNTPAGDEKKSESDYYNGTHRQIIPGGDPDRSLLERQLDFIILGEHLDYDHCYDHDTSICVKFFDEAIRRGLMTAAERQLSRQEDPDRSGRAYHPDFSEAALEIRQSVLNRYFDSARECSKDQPALLAKVSCDEKYCRPTAVLDKQNYNCFIKFY